ncbi:MAG: Fur family transcriptional regulator [Spirochaetaceae bacterium]|nr:Fur family transcriptional regulator [Spirochaetaceae bacterium]
MNQLNEIEGFLREHAIRPSFQRVQIFKYLKNNKTHPTVDTIYQDLHPVIPTFSKTTVYNTMKLFTDRGLVSAITIEEGETRFDGDTSTHGHFKCTNCGELHDLFFDEPVNIPSLPEGFQLQEMHYYGWGLCPRCSK